MYYFAIKNVTTWSDHSFFFCSMKHETSFSKLFSSQIPKTVYLSLVSVGKQKHQVDLLVCFSLIWRKQRDWILSHIFCLQEFSWKRYKSSVNKRPSVSQLGTTWPPSYPDALPWSTVILTMTRSLMKMTGLTEVTGPVAHQEAVCWKCIENFKWSRHPNSRIIIL